MAKVSIVIPIYNVATWLDKCLTSVLNQSLYDIEIICIDDYSQDGSRQILEEYAAKDNRIIAIYNATNMGTSQTRKNGVAATTSDYIMFLDADDEFAPEACEVALHSIEEYKTDIVHFGTKIINCSDASEQRIAKNQAALTPYLNRIEEENLLLSCWKDQLFTFTLWNKIYRGDLCRHAFAMVSDGQYPKGQDLYAFFFIAYYAQSYMGIEDVLYFYNFGIGVTGDDIISLKKFDGILTEKNICDSLFQFRDESSNTSEVLNEVIDIIYQRFLKECVDKWYHYLVIESLSEGFNHLIEAWGFKEVLCTLASQQWYNRSGIAEKMLHVKHFCYQPQHSPTQSPLTIAAYYHSISNGGAQRVVASLCNIWVDMRDSDGNNLYNIILITDEDTDSLDYPIDNRISREYLPNYNTYIKSDYSTRFDAWKDILIRNKIDMVISSEWVAPCTLWDMLCVKGLSKRTAFAIHSHSFNCVPFRYKGNSGLGLTRIYMLSDGVVTLSECDRKFAECFSHNVEYIPNPINIDIHRTKQSIYDPNVFVWIGRFSYEKRPLDAIYMMSKVIQVIPDTILYMVGEGDNKTLEEMESLIDVLGLQRNVLLPGFTLDIEHYYSRASILICTSAYEGFPNVFSEALAHAIPIITYDLPWLTFIQDGRGILTVPQKRYDLLAEEVVGLLHNPAKCKSLGEQGRQQILELASHNIEDDWRLFINNTIHGTTNSQSIDTDIQILFNYLAMYQQEGRDNEIKPLRKNLNQAYTDKSEINAKLQQTYHEKSEINAKLQQTYKEKAERGIRIKELESEIKELKQQTNSTQQELNATKASFSFRLGHALTRPARWLRSKLRS